MIRIILIFFALQFSLFNSYGQKKPPWWKKYVDSAETYGKEKAKEKVKQYIDGAIADAVSFETPLEINQQNSFVRVAQPINFHPHKITSVSELYTPLANGDYSVDVTFYSSIWGGHRPSNGVPYKLGRADGRMSKAISALLFKGNLAHKSPWLLIDAAWKIQGGLKLEEMTQDEQKLITDLIPEDTSQLSGDKFDKFVFDFNKKFKKSMELDSVINFIIKNKDPKYLRYALMADSIINFRKKLTDKSIALDRLPDLLYDATGDGTPAFLATFKEKRTSEWGIIQPGVIGCFVVQQGFLKTNLLEFQINNAIASYPFFEVLAPAHLEV